MFINFFNLSLFQSLFIICLYDIETSPLICREKQVKQYPTALGLMVNFLYCRIYSHVKFSSEKIFTGDNFCRGKLEIATCVGKCLFTANYGVPLDRHFKYILNLSDKMLKKLTTMYFNFIFFRARWRPRFLIDDWYSS